MPELDDTLERDRLMDLFMQITQTCLLVTVSLFIHMLVHINIINFSFADLSFARGLAKTTFFLKQFF